MVYEVCYLAVFSRHLTCHLVFKPLTTILVLSDFGCMLSDGAIHFEDRFCTSRKGGTEGGGCTTLADSAWRRLQLPVEKPWSMPGGPFICFLAQTGIENAPFTL